MQNPDLPTGNGTECTPAGGRRIVIIYSNQNQEEVSYDREGEGWERYQGVGGTINRITDLNVADSTASKGSMG